MNPLVGIIMSSKSDLPIMKEDSSFLAVMVNLLGKTNFESKSKMKKIVFIILSIVCFTQTYSQIDCAVDGYSFNVSTKPLLSYQFPSDTTDQIITNTFISITKDSLYYADVMKYKKECMSLLLVKAAIKDLKYDVGFKMEEIILNTKTNVKGAILAVYTSVGNNVFLIQQSSSKYGSSSVKGNMVNIICKDLEAADIIANEIDKMVKAK